MRVHRPAGNDEVLPTIFSIHGGGYILGSNVMDNFLHDEWSPQLGTVGVSVEYRLSPETPYPGPLEDCYAGVALDVRARATIWASTSIGSASTG